MKSKMAGGKTILSKNAGKEEMECAVAELPSSTPTCESYQEQQSSCRETSIAGTFTGLSSGISLEGSVGAIELNEKSSHMKEHTPSSGQASQEQTVVTQKMAWYQVPLVTRSHTPEPRLLPRSQKYLILMTVSVAGCL